MIRRIEPWEFIVATSGQKMKAVHGETKTRRSLANIYAIYSILHYYKADFYNKQINM